jgi:NADH-quinone oxidoreductase subunit J
VGGSAQGRAGKRATGNQVLITIMFFALAAVLVGGALGVILSRNPVHSALFLVLCFFTSAVLWLLLEAEFLAVVLVLVYVGAVMVLFLFVVMMLDINIEKMREGFTRYAPLGAVITLIIVGELAWVLWFKQLGLDLADAAPPMAADYSNTAAVGEVLYTEYVYPFQLAAVVLLVAIVAAITLTLRGRTGARTQNVGRQVSVRRQDRVKLVKMDAERDR